jgi:membrane protein
VLDRLRALPSRWPWLRGLLAGKQRFDEVHGNELASAVTLAAFVSLFPLLLVTTAVLGFFSAGGTDVAGDVVSELGLTGEAAETVRNAVSAAEDNRRVASVLGLAGLLYSGLGLVGALQYAYNSVWQVKGRGVIDKAYGLAWLVGAGLLFVGSFALTAALNFLPGWLAPVSLVVGLATNLGLFLWTAEVLCNRRVGWKALVPGALVGAVGLEVLKVVGSLYVPRVVASSSALYGAIGTVFAILAWLLFFGRLVVVTAVINVMRWERGHGTVTVEIELPDLPGKVPVGATRAGQSEVAPESEGPEATDQ